MRGKIESNGTYGMLTVESAIEEKDARGRTQYLCRCACGGTRITTADRLLAGLVQSCGCMQKVSRTRNASRMRQLSPEREAQRIQNLMNSAEGIYQRDEVTWVAQIKIHYKTYHIRSCSSREKAIAARNEVISVYKAEGPEAAIRYIAESTAARKAKIYEGMRNLGRVLTREEISALFE